MALTFCTCLLLGLAAFPSLLAGQCETFTDEVRDGEPWQRPFGDGLVFRLRPTTQAPPNPPGWTIEVRAAPDAEHDFVWVATPPYRFASPRYLDTSYGRTAREAVSWNPRRFGFVTSDEHRTALAEVVRFLLWGPPGMAETAYDAAYDSEGAVLHSGLLINSEYPGTAFTRGASASGSPVDVSPGLAIPTSGWVLLAPCVETPPLYGLTSEEVSARSESV